MKIIDFFVAVGATFFSRQIWIVKYTYLEKKGIYDLLKYTFGILNTLGKM